jgi:hypothetical protein
VGVARHGGGGGGLGAVTLLFAAVIAVGSVGEPPLDAGAEEAATFFRDAGAGWIQAAEAAASLGMLAFMWYVIGPTLSLRRAEGDPPRRSTVALTSGVLVMAYRVLDASWDAAAHRGTDLDPALAAYAFDVGNLGFANAWLAMASFAVAWLGDPLDRNPPALDGLLCDCRRNRSGCRSIPLVRRDRVALALCSVLALGRPDVRAADPARGKGLEATQAN